MEHEGDGVTNCDWRTWKDHQKIAKKNPEDLEMRWKRETIQIPALRSARILGRVLETRRDLLSRELQWKIIS